MSLASVAAKCNPTLTTFTSSPIPVNVNVRNKFVNNVNWKVIIRTLSCPLVYLNYSTCKLLQQPPARYYLVATPQLFLLLHETLFVWYGTWAVLRHDERYTLYSRPDFVVNTKFSVQAGLSARYVCCRDYSLNMEHS